MEVAEIIIDVLFLLGVLYLAFFRSYFQEKGKNLATREDIQKITSLVENVKTQLQYSLQAKLVLKREEHDALLNYYTRLYAWFHSINTFNFTGVTHENLNILDERFTCLTTLHHNTNMALAKVCVLTDDDAFEEQAASLIGQILEYQKMTLDMIGKYKQICMNWHMEIIKGKSSITELHEKIQIALQEYFSNQLTAYLVMLTYVTSHRKLVTKQLKELTEEQNT